MKIIHFTRTATPLLFRYIGAVFCLALVSIVVNYTPTYASYQEWSNIGTLGYQTSANALNDHGAVVGSSYATQHEYHAFVWQGGQVKDIASSPNSTAYSINNNSEVVGVHYTPDSERHAFLWKNGQSQDLTPILGQAIAYDINDSSKIVGGQLTENGIRPFVYNPATGEIIQLAATGGIAYAINNNNDVVGFRVVDGYYQATLWRNNETISLGAVGTHVSSAARDINDNGEIVGWSADEYSWDQHAFYWKDGNIQAIGPSDGNNDAFDINNLGQIIGTNEVGDHVPSAFIWHNNELHDINVPDKYTYGVAINNAGQFVVNTSDGKAYISNVSELPPSNLQQIITDVEELVANEELQYPDARLLLALLEKAEEKIDKKPVACRILDTTLEEVAEMKQKGRLDTSIAEKLTGDIQSVRMTIGC